MIQHVIWSWSSFWFDLTHRRIRSGSDHIHLMRIRIRSFLKRLHHSNTDNHFHMSTGYFKYLNRLMNFRSFWGHYAIIISAKFFETEYIFHILWFSSYCSKMIYSKMVSDSDHFPDNSDFSNDHFWFRSFLKIDHANTGYNTLCYML